MRATVLLIVAVACREGFDLQPRPIDAAVDVIDATPDVMVDARPDAAITVVDFLIHCSIGPRSAAQVCSDAGFSKVVVAHAYHWFQCAGPGACPAGWAADGVSCPDWCLANDCSAVPYCGAGPVITERVGDGSLTVDPAEFYSCVGYNPGWRMRVQCSN